MSQELSSKTDVVSWESHDKLVKKTVLEPGQWDERGSPDLGGVAWITISKIEGETIQDSLYLSEGEKEIIIGEAGTALDKLIERCARKMFKGELSLVQLNGGQIKFQMCLKDFKNISPFFEWSLEERLKHADRHRQRGSQLFKNEKYSEAFSSYKLAAQIVVLCDVTTNKEVEELYKVICNNLALTKLQLDDPENAITLCNKVLEKEPNNVKSLLRRARGLTGIQEYVQAYKDINRVLQIKPHDKMALEMMNTVKKDITDQQVKEIDLCKKMLNFP